MAIKAKISINPIDGDSLKKLAGKIESLPVKNYKVFICDERPARSLKQNAYYWAVVLPIMADHLGYTKKEVHELFKMQFLTRNPIEIDGKTFYYSTSTRTLNSKQFSEYIDEIVALAQGMDVYIPEAGEIPDEALIKQY